MSNAKVDLLGQEINIAADTAAVYEAIRPHVVVQDGAILVAPEAQEAAANAAGITLEQLTAVHRATVCTSNALAMAAGSAAANAFMSNADLGRVMGAIDWGNNTIKVSVDRTATISGGEGRDTQTAYCQTLVTEVGPKSNEAARIRSHLRAQGAAMLAGNNG